MGQKYSQDELALHRGDLNRKVYTWFNSTTGVTTERNVICDVTINARGIYRGIVLYGWIMGGGNNTAFLQHLYSDFVLQIDFNPTPTYRGWQDRSIAYSEFQIWENDSDTLNWRICRNFTAASQSFSMEFREMPVAYWESINRGIKMHNPNTVADMTGYTLRYTL